MFRKLLYASASTLIVFCTLLPAAQCETRAGDLFLSLMAGGHLFEGNQDPFHHGEELDHALTVALGLGYQITDHLGTELSVNMTPTEAEPFDADVDVYPVRLDLFYNLTPDKKLVPYVAAGLGTITFSSSDFENDTDFAVNYGCGLRYTLTDVLALRADVRHLISFKETHSNLLYTLGFMVTFGGDSASAAPASEPVVETPAPVAEQDSDNDGVVDSKDACPHTAQGVAVNATGCPLDSDNDGVTDDMDKCPATEAGVTVGKDGCPAVRDVQEADSDHDGVVDSKDKCDNTPENVVVNTDGCPIDTDLDGVSDDQDACPGTPDGATVDERGCWVIQGLTFESGSADILASSFANLDDVAELLLAHPDITLEIQGYTDNRGNAEFNRRLSENRARAVKHYMVSKGVPESRLTTRGYGIENPVATNDTAEGRARNRRVELKPLY